MIYLHPTLTIIQVEQIKKLGLEIRNDGRGNQVVLPKGQVLALPKPVRERQEARS